MAWGNHDTFKKMEEVPSEKKFGEEHVPPIARRWVDVLYGDNHNHSIGTSKASEFVEFGNISLDEAAREEIWEWFGTIINLDLLLDENGPFMQQMDRTDRIMERKSINRHGFEHVKRIACDSMLIYLATRGVQTIHDKRKTEHELVLKVLSVGLAGLLHDVGYTMELQGKSLPEIRRILTSKNSNKAGVDVKEIFARHAELGGGIVGHWIEQLILSGKHTMFLQPDVRNIELFKPGEHHNFVINATRPIISHSISGRPLSIVELMTSRDVTMIVYLADKLHLNERAPQTGLMVEGLLDNNHVRHQRYALAITQQRIVINPETNTFELHIDVEPELVNSTIRESEREMNLEKMDIEQNLVKLGAKTFSLSNKELNNPNSNARILHLKKKRKDLKKRKQKLKKQIEAVNQGRGYNNNKFLSDFFGIFAKAYNQAQGIVQTLMTRKVMPYDENASEFKVVCHFEDGSVHEWKIKREVDYTEQIETIVREGSDNYAEIFKRQEMKRLLAEEQTRDPQDSPDSCAQD